MISVCSICITQCSINIFLYFFCNVVTLTYKTYIQQVFRGVTGSVTRYIFSNISVTHYRYIAKCYSD